MKKTRGIRLARGGFPPVKTTAIHDVEPLRDSERVDEYLTQIRKHKDKLFAEFIEECRRDPRFLDKALKELKPLRQAGRTKRPSLIAENIISALKGLRPKDIVAAIAKTECVSEPQARRLYDAARRRLK